MEVKDVLKQIKVDGDKVTSLASGRVYTIEDFVNTVSKKLKFTKRERTELETKLIEYIKPQTDKSKYVEQVIKKYDFKFSDGVYLIHNKVVTMEEIYRLLWKNERLLPVDTDDLIENIEKISEPMQLQIDIFKTIREKAIAGKSEYLASLYRLYPDIPWKELLYNILVPQTTPMFHIFYDDGVGGTGKSTLLEVLTMIVGEGLVSNVLLDQFGNRFIFANMLGKYLNVGDDNGKNDELQNVGTLKSIITGNRVTIDRKNIAPIEVRIFAKQLFATNILPYIDFTDGGIMRRLNIVKMNRVIPKTAVLCDLDEEELGHIVYEVLYEGAGDLKHNNNDLAITTSSLYRFLTLKPYGTYNDYKMFCMDNGFRMLNIINFEVKKKFIEAYKQRQGELPVKASEFEDIF